MLGNAPFACIDPDSVKEIPRPGQTGKLFLSSIKLLKFLIIITFERFSGVPVPTSLVKRTRIRERGCQMKIYDKYN